MSHYEYAIMRIEAIGLDPIEVEFDMPEDVMTRISETAKHAFEEEYDKFVKFEGLWNTTAPGFGCPHVTVPIELPSARLLLNWISTAGWGLHQTSIRKSSRQMKPSGLLEGWQEVEVQHFVFLKMKEPQQHCRTMSSSRSRSPRIANAPCSTYPSKTIFALSPTRRFRSVAEDGGTKNDPSQCSDD